MLPIDGIRPARGVETVILIDLSKVPEEERDDLRSINASLLQLAARRVDRIDFLEEPYIRSRMAWKLGQFTQAMTYRFIALAEGTALAWNHDNILSATLNARALTETFAAYWHFAQQLSGAMMRSPLNLDAIGRLLDINIFGTRDEDILRENPDLRAPQILKAIDAIDKRIIPHFRSHYDRLSERCHPNSLGHMFLFSAVNRADYIVSFSAPPSELYFLPLKCALGSVTIFSRTMTVLEELTVQLAAEHHKIRPSPLVGENDDAT